MKTHFSPQTRHVTLTTFSKKPIFNFKLPISTIVKITVSQFRIPLLPCSCSWILKEAATATAKSLQSCPTVQIHRRQPTRLPRPWDSPGKNTGVGCHFLLQWMKVKSEIEVAQSCLTLNDPMDCSLPGSFIHGIFQARVLEWGAIAFSPVSEGSYVCLSVWDSFCLLFHMSTMTFATSAHPVCSWRETVGHQGHTHHSLPSGPLGSLCPLHSSHVGAYRKYWVAFASHLREGKSMHLRLNFPSKLHRQFYFSLPLPHSALWPQGQSWSFPHISQTCSRATCLLLVLAPLLGTQQHSLFLLAHMILSFTLALNLLFYPRE